MQESKAVLGYATRLSRKDETVTTETSEAVRAACRARRWALIVPREHGAWGLLLVPLFTGVAAAVALALLLSLRVALQWDRAVVLRLGRLALPHALPPLRAAAELAAASVLGGAVLLIALRALRVAELQVVLTRAASLLRR